MQDAMYADELLSQLSFLRYNKLINPAVVNRIKSMILRGDFDSAGIHLDKVFDKYKIERESIKDFIDNYKENPTHSYIDGENENRTNNDEFIDKNQFKILNPGFSERDEFINEFPNEMGTLKKDIEILRNELNIFRSRYRAEKFENKKRSDELLELNNEYQSLKTKHDKLTSEIQQQRIEDKIPQYVADVSKKLDDDDTLFMGKSQRWSRTGIVLSLASVLIALYTFKSGIETLSNNENIGYVTLIFVFFRGFLAIGILSWVAYLCFNMSSSYIHESILRKDRQHALSFGRLFLQIYGDTATKDDAIEVFKDWNRSGDSAFSKTNSSPPNFLKILDALKKTESNAKNDPE